MNENENDLVTFNGMSFREHQGYLALDNGTVYSLKRNKYLIPFQTIYGYNLVKLCNNGKVKLTRVHRFIAETFQRQIKENEETHHINGIRTDNRADNLVIIETDTHKRLHYIQKEFKRIGIEDNSGSRLLSLLLAENENTTRILKERKAKKK